MNYLANINDKDLTVVILAEVLRRMGTKYFSYFFHVQICILEVRTIFFNFLHCGPVIITLPTTIADKNFHGDKYNIPAYPDVLVNFFSQYRYFYIQYISLLSPFIFDPPIRVRVIRGNNDNQISFICTGTHNMQRSSL
jgi:hypothetical protein